MFKITDYVEFGDKNRAVCPSCEQQGHGKRKNLSLVPGTDRAYKCFRGCTAEEIREALGVRKDRIVPAPMAPTARATPTTISPQKVREAHQKLMGSDGSAKQWLHARGITDEMIAHYKLGITRAKCGDRHLFAITIPIPNGDSTAYWQKKRIAPWIPEAERPEGYQPWSQYGIPCTLFFTYKPVAATQTWLCEGEWDAMMLGWKVREANLAIAVATFTTGAGNVPPPDTLSQLPGEVIILYDRQDKPTKQGNRPGEAGATKVATALGDRARIAMVPMPDNCTVEGWDVSDALNGGYTLDSFLNAAGQAVRTAAPKEEVKVNPLRSRLTSTDELIARAPEYVEWLVPDLLTTNELFGLAAPPRGGKSLMCLLLSKAVATGEKFLDRPTTQGSVIYVNLEDSEAKIRERVEAQGWAEGLPVYWLDRFKLSELTYLIDLADGIDDLRLIILDTLSRIRSDDKTESSAEMGQVLEPLQEFAKSRNVCVLLVHHTTKVNPDRTSLDEIFDTVRGSTAIRGTCRGLMVIAPGDNCYRLAVENGWGKHDLKIRLDASRLEWQLLGKWTPYVNFDQRELALDYLNKVGSATIDQIAEETSIPRRSLYTVLARLCADGMLVKTGSQRSAVYNRPVQRVQQLNSLLNSSNEEGESDRGDVQQKNKISSLGDQRESDHTSHAKCDHILEVITPSDFVEEVITGDSNPDTTSISAVQQKSNSSSTVELSEGKVINAYIKEKWRKAKYIRHDDRSILSRRTQKLEDSVIVEWNRQRVRVAVTDLEAISDE